MEALVVVLNKIENVAILILLLACGGLGYLHIIWRREEREDRQKMLEAFNSITSALNELRVAIAAMTGRTL